VMRRLIGLAQLPLLLDDEARANLLDQARKVLLEKNWRLLWQLGGRND